MGKQETAEGLFRAIEETLHTVFKEQRYEVPYYQRPYAWETDNAEELFDDLFTAFQSSRKGDDSYFLGSIVLFDGGKNDRHKIIDGQQRLVTLQLLLLALARKIDDQNNKEELLSYVRSKENVFAGTKSEPVVKIGERYQKFFGSLIYSDSDLDEQALSAPENLLLKNYRYFEERIREAKNFDPIKFGVFIMQRCVVASLRAQQEQSALRIFSVLNDRGVDLHPVDILKARLIATAGLSEDEREKYARDWEEQEYTLGRSEFLNLFNYIRMIFVKSRTKKLLHEEISEELNTKPKIKNFLDDELPLYCELYAEILNHPDSQVRNIIKVLEATRQKDWVAPVLFLLKHKKKLEKSLLPILQKIAAISIMMLCYPFTEGQRVGRYGRILTDLAELVDKKKKNNQASNLVATNDEIARVTQNLLTNAYSLRNIRAFLLWSETLVGDGARSIESGSMTVEHLLPNTPGRETYWLSRFPDQKWEEYSNNIGNLVLVSSRMNRDLARKDFPEKKKVVSKKLKNGWIITDQALEQTEWNAAHIEQRGKDLIHRATSVMKSKLS
jgi:uncharacterized protein with ParB-like and HNH nuclease domain